MRILVAVLLLALVGPLRALEMTDKVSVDANGLAARGYDPVAYFLQKRAVKGRPTLAASVEPGVTYHFSSEENLLAFLKDPARFVPQYGGFCALGATKADNVTADPQAFRVVGDKLYLLASARAAREWSKDPVANIAKADAAWKAAKAR
jgi:YHS domain-containing protein